jgi:hypothetical protein
MNYSLHGQQRLQQRGLSRSDAEIIMMHGTETRDGYYLRDKDVRASVQELRKQIIKLTDLSGKFVVVKNDTLLTAYHPSKKKQKRILTSIYCSE